ncbi:conserved Plasmodium protein, unknown function [Plasmodium chabaudi adami]|uniref:Alpha/beta hydrolase n=1 Tax=Plasmodium chabaudi adami TaxID=5826 RepID=A0A1C6YLZ2_PLACE|nr:conserved Plasmodium protein, unknown function [Plasmodium chabaudi adami]SCM24387.1 conserved Plasmodium protein, unknown function [Plasmodium chabaudi adami]
MKLFHIFFFLIILFIKENIGVKIYSNDSVIFDINSVLKSRLASLYRKGNKLNNYFFSYIEKNGKKNKCYRYIQDTLYDSNTQIMKQEVFKCLNTSKNILQKTFHDVINKIFLYIKNVFLKKYFIFFLLYIININCDALVGQIDDPFILNNYNLKENASPAIYNLKYEEIEIPNTNGIKGWLIRSNKKTNKLFLLLHGYNSNRQACLFFLNILKKLNVHNDTNIFIPDMKNFNERGVEDIYNILRHFKDNMSLNEVNVYTQSSTNLLVLLLSKRYKNKIVSKSKTNLMGNIIPYSNDKKTNASQENAGSNTENTDANKANNSNTKSKGDNKTPAINNDNVIYIDKYIFDSPILNLHRTINVHFKLNDIEKKINAEKAMLNADGSNMYDKRNVLSYLMSFFMWLLNNQLKGHLYDFNFNKLLNENDINPSNIYILHSVNDNISLVDILSSEVKQNRLVSLKNIYIFKNGMHANIHEASQAEYSLIIKRILKGFNIFDFLRYIPLKSKMSSLNF